MTTEPTDRSEPARNRTHVAAESGAGGVMTQRVKRVRGHGIYLPVTSPRHPDEVNAWVPIAALAVVAVLLWVAVALDR